LYLSLSLNFFKKSQDFLKTSIAGLRFYLSPKRICKKSFPGNISASRLLAAGKKLCIAPLILAAELQHKDE
jgi:hypothetical protein